MVPKKRKPPVHHVIRFIWLIIIFVGYCAGDCHSPVHDYSAAESLFPKDCGWTYPTLGQRIVGGRPTRPHAWPWLARVGTYNSFHCVGSLITKKHLLTAAHCRRNPASMLVRLGDHNSQGSHFYAKDYNVSDIISHERFDAEEKTFDIAVVVLKDSVDFVEGVIWPICLPFPTESRELEKPGQSLWAGGWGGTYGGSSSNSNLKEVQLTVVSIGRCKLAYLGWYVTIFCGQICAGSEDGKDTCQGDSGGPLMAPAAVKGQERYYQVGIVSHGEGCGKPDYPGVNTRVSRFLFWTADKVMKTM